MKYRGLLKALFIVGGFACIVTASFYSPVSWAYNAYYDADEPDWEALWGLFAIGCFLIAGLASESCKNKNV